MSLLKESTVVYVEDEQEIRTQITIFLKRRVKAIYEAANGEEGLEKIKEHNPDVVITDIEMPVMNGLEMIKKIRELYDGSKPIIVITGYLDDEHFSSEADIYVYKPIDMYRLVEVIEEVLEKYNGSAKEK